MNERLSQSEFVTLGSLSDPFGEAETEAGAIAVGSRPSPYDGYNRRVWGQQPFSSQHELVDVARREGIAHQITNHVEQPNGARTPEVVVRSVADVLKRIRKESTLRLTDKSDLLWIQSPHGQAFLANNFDLHLSVEELNDLSHFYNVLVLADCKPLPNGMDTATRTLASQSPEGATVGDDQAIQENTAGNATSDIPQAPPQSTLSPHLKNQTVKDMDPAVDIPLWRMSLSDRGPQPQASYSNRSFRRAQPPAFHAKNGEVHPQDSISQQRRSISHERPSPSRIDQFPWKNFEQHQHSSQGRPFIPRPNFPPWMWLKPGRYPRFGCSWFVEIEEYVHAQKHPKTLDKDYIHFLNLKNEQFCEKYKEQRREQLEEELSRYMPAFIKEHHAGQGKLHDWAPRASAA